jgi:hypothetical protein
MTLFPLYSQLRQFLKETGLENAYRDANMAQIGTLFDISTRNDPVSATIQEATMTYCQKVIGNVDELSMLTREWLGGLHDDSTEVNHHNAMFNPRIMANATRRQYMQQLHQLALFLVRSTVTHPPPPLDPDYYGKGVNFCFTQEQRESAMGLHTAVIDLIDCKGTHTADEKMDVVVENLNKVAVSVLFGEGKTEGSGSWDSAWRRFFAFGNLDRHGRPAPAARVAIWLSRVRFIMKLVASHKIHTQWRVQAHESECPQTSDECVTMNPRSSAPFSTTENLNFTSLFHTTE